MKKNKQFSFQQTRICIFPFEASYPALWDFFFTKFSNSKDLLNKPLCNEKLLLHLNAKATTQITSSKCFFTAFLRISSSEYPWYNMVLPAYIYSPGPQRKILILSIIEQFSHFSKAEFAY